MNPSSGWLDLCRAAGAAAVSALEAISLADRGERLERGEGGDMTMTLDRVAEDAILAEFERSGRPLTVVSEEAGVVELNGGGPPFAVVDPVDGSLNAKRGLPFHAVSIAIASSPSLDTVEVGYVLDIGCGDEWHAERGEGAWLGDERLRVAQSGRLEVVGVETARPELIAAVGRLGSDRVRALGSVALSMCLVAAGRLDAMLSLRKVRSVDVAAGVLLVREAGGLVKLPDVPAPAGIDLEMRSRVLAAADAAGLAAVGEVAAGEA